MRDDTTLTIIYKSKTIGQQGIFRLIEQKNDSVYLFI